MKEIQITLNEADQRIDRYIRKLLGQASLSFIYKQIRKKNIVVNDQKVNEKYMLQEGDILKIYFSDQTIEKLKSKKEKPKSRIKLDVAYEDDNIIVINKPAGLLSHAAKKDYTETNLVDEMIAYLIEKGDYKPSRTSTFTPALGNRLDRNTSGLVIGAKNYQALQELNKIQRENQLKKFYKTIVVGQVYGEKIEKAHFEKIANKDNQVRILKNNNNGEKEVITAYKALKTGKNYSLLEIDLITGRTHQIRAHLDFLNMPLLGDRKYGRARVNKHIRNKYGLNNQLLHCYKVIFNGFSDNLAYLNGKVVEVANTNILNQIIRGEIDEKI